MYKNTFSLITDEESRLPFFITSVGFNDEQEAVDRPDGYPSYHWLYSAKGKGVLIVDGIEHVLPENTGFILQPSYAHKYHALTETWGTRWITFEGYAVPRLLKQLNISSRYNIYTVNHIKKLDQMYSDIYHSAHSGNPSSGIECSHLLYKFLIELQGCVSGTRERLKTEKRFQLEPILTHMQQHYSRDLSLDELSSLIDVTPQHLCRIFKQAYNMRPFEYLTGIRIQKAKEILTGPGSFKLTEVAGSTGYNDTSYFCAVFKEHEGVTPVEFRRLHGKS